MTLIRLDRVHELATLSQPVEQSPPFAATKSSLSCLAGKRLVFFSVGHSSKKFILVQAWKYGIEPIVIDNYDSWARKLVSDGLVTAFIGVDMSRPVDQVLDEALRGLAELSLSPPDGVCTFVELSVSLAARLARALGCPGPNPVSVDAARDKFKTRSIMQQRGIPHVRNMLIRSESDLSIAAAAVGFPAVLKPVAGAASLGVLKVDSHNTLLDAYRWVVSALSELIVSAGSLERPSTKIDPDGEGGDIVGISAELVINTTVLMEEYLEGPEVDVDLVLSGGERRYAAVIDNGPTFEPFFGETWACLPSQLSGEKQRELEAMAIDAVKALGFTDGVYHVELKYTPNGPRLIEVNARMGGGPTRMIHKLVSGIDLVREQFLIALGEPSRPTFSEAPLQFIAYAFINCRATGAVSDISFLDKYRQVPGVVWILPYVRPYERCVGPEDGHPSWLGDIVVAVSENSETALRLVKKLEKEIADEFASRRITHGRCHD